MGTWITWNGKPANPCPNLDPSVASCLRRYIASSGPITNMRKWGVSNLGHLRTFDFQPKNADSEIKVANQNSKTWQPWQP